MSPATFESAPPEEARQRSQNVAPGLFARLQSGLKASWLHLSTTGVHLGFFCDFRARLAEPSVNKCELSVLATKSGCSWTFPRPLRSLPCPLPPTKTRPSPPLPTPKRAMVSPPALPTASSSARTRTVSSRGRPLYALCFPRMHLHSNIHLSHYCTSLSLTGQASKV